MTVRTRRMLLTLLSGSALAAAPVAFATVVVPAVGHADTCSSDQNASPSGQGTKQCNDTQPQDNKLSCPDGTVVDDQNKQCVDLLSGISKQLQALPPPPSLAAATGGGGGGGLPNLGAGGLPGIPSLGSVYLPDLVLPSVGFQLVPNIQPSFPITLGSGLAAGSALAGAGSAVQGALANAPAPQLPPPPSLPAPSLPPPPNLNPLGLPPPPF
jgi:hypothetical protein